MNQKTIVLVPMGHVSDDLLAWSAGRLAEVLAQGVVVDDEAIPLPTENYNARRQQYRGRAMLRALRSHYGEYGSEVDRMLGVADVDCYARGLNFIFGQAMMRRPLAFVALPRLRPSFYGQPEDQALFRERAIKEMVHELGHTWGLSHCDDPKCVMHFSNSLRDTDIKGARFCLRCARLRGGGDVANA